MSGQKHLPHFAFLIWKQGISHQPTTIQVESLVSEVEQIGGAIGSGCKELRRSVRACDSALHLSVVLRDVEAHLCRLGKGLPNGTLSAGTNCPHLCCAFCIVDNAQCRTSLSLLVFLFQGLKKKPQRPVHG